MNNFFDILQEAKNPTSKPLTIKVQEEKTTDYTEDVDEMGEEQEETEEEEQDNSQNESEDNQEEEQSSDEDEEESEEETDSEEGTEDDEPTDYTEGANDDLEGSGDGDTSSDGSEQEQQQDLSPEEQEDAKKNARLIKNCITLYYNIISCINRLEKINGCDIETNKIILQVKSNLTDLSVKMYDFVTLTFNNNGYVKNLYIYNYFIEAFKINIEMLRKINTFENIS